MKHSADFYKVVNAVLNTLRQGGSVPYYMVANSSEGGAYTPEDDFRELRLSLLAYNTADDDEDVADQNFRSEHSDCDIWTLFRGNDFICLAIDPDNYITSSYDLRDMIADDYDLERAEITEGMNGYPRGLRGCVLLNDKDATFESMERMAELYGVEIVSLRRKDGWQLWESQGTVYELYDFQNILGNRDDNALTFGSFKEYADFLRETASDEMVEDMAAHALIEKAKEIEDKETGDNEFIHTSTYDISYYELLDRHVSHYSYDTWNYCLALDCMISD